MRRVLLADMAEAGPDERHDAFALRDHLLTLPLAAFFYIVELDDENRGLWTIHKPWERVVFVREDNRLFRVSFFGSMAATVVEVDDLLSHLRQAAEILDARSYEIAPDHYEIEKARLNRFIWQFQHEWENGGQEP